MKVFVHNRLVPSSKASVSVFDHGLLYGDGVFETMRAYNGTVFKLDAHLKRLRRSSSLIKLRLPYGVDDLRSIIYKTLKANRLHNASIRVTVTRGKGPVGLDTSLCPRPTLIVMAKQFKPYPGNLYKKGVKVIISDVRRNLKEAVDPEIKSLNFLNNIIAKSEAVKKSAFEAIMLNHKGSITEGTVSNIFLIHNGTLLTPSVEAGILDGITRQTIIKIAQRKKIRTVQKLIKPDELYGADEVFLTNTTLEVMPVRQVNSTIYKKREGTAMLMSEYGKTVEREIQKHS